MAIKGVSINGVSVLTGVKFRENFSFSRDKEKYP